MKTNPFVRRSGVFALLITFLFTTHSIAQKTVNASDIAQDIKSGKSISYENVTIIGDLDMTFMNEKISELPAKKRWYKNGGSNAVEEQIEEKISFVNCVFENNVYAYYHDEESEYTFIAHFENDVTFKGCTFKENAMFKYSDFEQSANFKGSKFHGKTTFKYATFDENVSFADTNFEELAIFKYTKFKEGVSFNNATFEDTLDIKYVEVNGDFNIDNMTVEKNIDSKYSDINGKGFAKFLLDNRN